MKPQLYLASQSPRRQQLLEQLGVAYHLLEVDLDEDWRPPETARAYVERLALAKAEQGRAGLDLADNAWVLGADTAVVLDDVILGKPGDEAHALEMLAALSGRAHQVFTGIALTGHMSYTAVSLSTVTFRPLTLAERQAYWASGEPRDKAGGYAVQGQAAAFIAHLEGSYSGVMGLPLYETAGLLLAAGLWRMGE